MGLSNFPSASEGVLPVLVMNTVLSVALLKNIFRSLLQIVGASGSTATSSYSADQESDEQEEGSRERRVSITQYKTLCDAMTIVECCVCLSGFEANQEVSELPCKHFFHRACLDKWFHNNHITCPLCRSIN
ncbi:hypothetical protein VNO77_44082 [Canavalia gladiata]|uniref:RING-type domain-containing protein n=1 Tax=Canavalia gladiata TaxID=3824 RepID=A0AAN9JYZ5_CANGL